MHLFVLCGYQGADSDAEQLALTNQLFDAALGELHAVASGQPCLLVGDFNVEPSEKTNNKQQTTNNNQQQPTTGLILRRLGH